MILTAGERAVWAAAFVRAMSKCPGDMSSLGTARIGAQVAGHYLRELWEVADHPGDLTEEDLLLVRAMLGKE